MDVSNDNMNAWLNEQRTRMNATDDVTFYISILEHLTLLWADQENDSKEKADYEKAMEYVRNKLNKAQKKESVVALDALVIRLKKDLSISLDTVVVRLIVANHIPVALDLVVNTNVDKIESLFFTR